MDIGYFLKLMTEKNASDMFLTTGAPVFIKVEGRLYPLGNTGLPSGMVKKIAYSLMDEGQVPVFERDLEFNMAIAVKDAGRFRVNCFKQRGEVGMVIRAIKSEIPSLDQLKLPPVLKDIIMEQRGLVLVVGSTGSGKSTTLAAMIDHRNRTAPGHILTIEDPIEFLHPQLQCVVDQREVGLDTRSFEEALRHGLREAPDVILIGEIRDELTMQHAMKYAETGHLCLATLHANNANQAVDRMINFFPAGARKQALLDLSLNLRGVIAQRLVPGLHSRLVPATEVMLQSSYIADLIQKGEIDQVKGAIGKSNDQGMHTFDQSLYELYLAGEIGLQQALENADSRTDLSLRIRMHAGARPQAAAGLELRH